MDALKDISLWAQLILLIPLGVILAIAAWTDAKERKVYNKLTYPSFLLGIALHGIAMGWSGLGSGLLAGVLVIVIGLVILPFGVMGGGDIKLFAVVGTFLGLKGLTEVFFYSVIMGTILGLAMALTNGYLMQVFKRIGQFLVGLWRLLIYRTRHLAPKIEQDARGKIPFAVAIFVGGILAWSDAFYGWPNWIDMVLDFQF